MQEKRGCHRLNIELPACYNSPGTPKNLSLATTIDISATGLCFLTREKLKVGLELPIQVTLPKEERLVLNVKVIWAQEIYTSITTEFRIGLRVMEPMNADAAKFVRFYAAQLRASLFKKTPLKARI